jgi:hypothetical protein
MVSAGRSTRECDAQVAVAFRVEPGIADAAFAGVVAVVLAARVSLAVSGAAHLLASRLAADHDDEPVRAVPVDQPGPANGMRWAAGDAGTLHRPPAAPLPPVLRRQARPLMRTRPIRPERQTGFSPAVLGGPPAPPETPRPALPPPPHHRHHPPRRHAAKDRRNHHRKPRSPQNPHSTHAPPAPHQHHPPAHLCWSEAISLGSRDRTRTYNLPVNRSPVSSSGACSGEHGRSASPA